MKFRLPRPPFTKINLSSCQSSVKYSKHMEYAGYFTVERAQAQLSLFAKFCFSFLKVLNTQVCLYVYYICICIAVVVAVLVARFGPHLMGLCGTHCWQQRLLASLALHADLCNGCDFLLPLVTRQINKNTRTPYGKLSEVRVEQINMKNKYHN